MKKSGGEVGLKAGPVGLHNYRRTTATTIAMLGISPAKGGTKALPRRRKHFVIEEEFRGHVAFIFEEMQVIINRFVFHCLLTSGWKLRHGNSRK